ncbi:MAG: chemotaxis protein CheX [bacterium]
MSTDDTNILGRVTIETLEQFAFLLGDPPDVNPPSAMPSTAWVVRLIFSGPRTGKLGMATTPCLARQMAANLFGIERDDVSDEQAVDALKELLNVTCGDYLHEIEGNTPIYDLSAPTISSVDDLTLQTQLAGWPQVALNVEGQPLFVFLGA